TAAKCTNCGANIEIDAAKDAGICPHCGTAFVSEKVIKNYNAAYYDAVNYDDRTGIRNVRGAGTFESQEHKYIKNADVFFQMKDYEKAGEQLNLAAGVDPSDWRVWFGFMRLHTKNFTDLSSGAYKRYREYYDKAAAVASLENLSELKNLCSDYEISKRVTDEKQAEKRERQVKTFKKVSKRVLPFVCIGILLVLVVVLPITLTPGLKYQYSKSNGSYSVASTKGVNTQRRIVIPAKHKGKPVTSIREWAFSQSKLTGIEIPSSVTSIGRCAFYNCSGLTSIEIPSSVTSIGDYAFENCSGLTSIVIPSLVTSIASGTFSGCSGLKSIKIPPSVTSIESSTFRDCSNLTDITVPFVGASKTATGEKAVFGFIFGYFTDSVLLFGADTVTQREGTYQYYVVKGPYTASPRTYYFYYIPRSLRTIVITGGDSIPYNAFYNCSMLTSIVIPLSVTNIRQNAFYNCSRLTSVYYGGADDVAWNAVSIDYTNTPLTNATRYYYSETYQAGDYWHYVDNVPIIYERRG
ncbi:MAG: leucine-rich repeat protein, partial [Clostridiales bacterium]|nr:leucine-rich repeat protein [Clostridiales bacterium]